MKKYIFMILCFFMTANTALATITGERKIIGILRGWDDKTVNVLSEDKILKINKEIVSKKYPKLKNGMIIELEMTKEELSEVKIRSNH